MMYGQLIVVTLAEKFSEVNVYNIKNETITIGRDKGNSLIINNGFVSAKHGYIKYVNGAFYYVDKDSANGTFFNGKPMRKSDEKNMYPVMLNDGDILFIGDNRSKNGIYIIYSAFTDDNYCWRTLDIDEGSELSIGRSKTNDIAILNNNVSANHAKIVNNGDSVIIYDTNSTNGIVVNLNKIEHSQSIVDYDKMKIDDSLFVFVAGKLICGIKKAYVRNLPGTVLKTSISENEDIQSVNNKITDNNDIKYVNDKEEREGTLIVLSCENGKIEINQYDASDQVLYIGRNINASKCNVKINNSLISREHAIIKRANGHFWYVEKGLNKFAFNGNKSDFVPQNKKRKLNSRDYMILGDMTENNGVLMYFLTDTSTALSWKVCKIKRHELLIGRSVNNDICIPILSVSREHAKIIKRDNSYILIDRKSSNGIFVNNNMIKKQKQLNVGDCIDIVNSKIIFMGDYIIYGIPQNAAFETGKINQLEFNSDKNSKEKIQSDEREYKYAFKGGMNVELEHISRIVPCKAGTGINGGKKKYILMDISCRINAGQLVAILGGSGAGKTTFMNCINGFEPATSGTVKINGKELYQNYHALKSQIGYVPQQDIIHDELTLKSMLTYVAKLRLPKDLSKVEIAHKVNEVMEMVDLAAHANTLIKKMSGGQRKRASIAVELLCDPELFFLDEPTSGLDPEAETLLMKRLQLLAHKKGKTVIVITHTLQNIHLFDKVVFLAPGGKLCFYGSPENAIKFFEVDNLSDAYEKISMNIDGYVDKFNKGRKIS